MREIIEIGIALFRKKGYLPEEGTVTAAQYQEALGRYRQENPLTKPLVPSAEEPWREAECLKCRDQLWLQVKLGEHEYGVKPCECQAEQAARDSAKRRLEASGIPDTRLINNLASFVPVVGVIEAMEAAAALGKGEANFKLLLIVGRPGNGKTHLGYAAGLEALGRGLTVRFAVVLELLSKLRMAMNRQGGSGDIAVEEIVAEYKYCGFLILDDYGAEQGTDWAGAVLEEIINYRYAHEKELIVTSNRDIKGLPQPIVSRFRDARIAKLIVNEAPDYRPRLGKVKEEDIVR